VLFRSAAKQANVRETLARIGGVTAARELPIHAAPDEWRYRRRMRLHVGRHGALGYRQARSHRLVEIDDCVIADSSLTAMLPVVRQIASRLRMRLRTLELLANGRNAVVVRGIADGAFVAADAQVLTDLLAESPTIAGIEIAGRNWKRSVGDVRIVVHPDDLGTTIVQRPGAFSQVNPAANRLLVDTVRTLASPAARILDLFCGAGNMSLPLARGGADVLGVDASATAIADARASAARGGVEHVRFEVLPALRFLRQQGLAGADLVLLDPPRAGAAAEVGQLARLRPPRILYVSCDPATLARDVRVLVSAGYTVDRVQPLDLFPQTPHVETVLEAHVAID
jgi:23S rRNA (uracil1939-C5)-methyltransferase